MVDHLPYALDGPQGKPLLFELRCTRQAFCLIWPLHARENIPHTEMASNGHANRWSPGRAHELQVSIQLSSQSEDNLHYVADTLWRQDVARGSGELRQRGELRGERGELRGGEGKRRGGGVSTAQAPLWKTLASRDAHLW